MLILDEAAEDILDEFDREQIRNFYRDNDAVIEEKREIEKRHGQDN